MALQKGNCHSGLLSPGVAQKKPFHKPCVLIFDAENIIIETTAKRLLLTIGPDFSGSFRVFEFCLNFNIVLSTEI